MIELLWNITIGSWVTAVAIIFLRLLFRKHLSARSKYLLWLLLLVRLMLPVLPESPSSVMNLTKEPAPVTESTPISQKSVQTTVAEQEETPIATMAPARSRPTSRQIVLAIWLSGMLLCGSTYAAMTVKTALRLRSMEEIPSPGVQNRYEAIRMELGIHRKITLRYGDRAMIGGLLHPTLILPRELTGQRLKAAMTHELMHYKSGDLWIAAWWRVLCCLYWFNPVVWLCFFWARRDCERACDQRVLDSESVSPAVYAALLYEEATMKPKIRVGTTAFGGGGLKARIRGIADYHKSKTTMTVLAIVLCLLISACTMTDSMKANTAAGAEKQNTSAKSTELSAEESASQWDRPVELSDHQKQAVMAHIMCQWMDGMQFDPEDHDYFWRVTSYYASNVFMDYDTMDEDTAHATFKPEQVVELENILFPTLGITDSAALPGIPGYVQDENTTVPVELLNNGDYRFPLGNYGDVTLDFLIVSQNELQATLESGEEGSLGIWNVTLTAEGSIKSVKLK